jgi:hypothetical protein
METPRCTALSRVALGKNTDVAEDTAVSIDTLAQGNRSDGRGSRIFRNVDVLRWDARRHIRISENVVFFLTFASVQ